MPEFYVGSRRKCTMNINNDYPAGIIVMVGCGFEMMMDLLQGKEAKSRTYRAKNVEQVLECGQLWDELLDNFGKCLKDRVVVNGRQIERQLHILQSCICKLVCCSLLDVSLGI